MKLLTGMTQQTTRAQRVSIGLIALVAGIVALVAGIGVGYLLLTRESRAAIAANQATAKEWAKRTNWNAARKEPLDGGCVRAFFKSATDVFHHDYCPNTHSEFDSMVLVRSQSKLRLSYVKLDCEKPGDCLYVHWEEALKAQEAKKEKTE